MPDDKTRHGTRGTEPLSPAIMRRLESAEESARTTEDFLRLLSINAGIIIETLRANFPYSPALWIDIHQVVNAPIGTTTIFNWKAQPGREAVIKHYAFAVLQGAPANLSFRLLQNGTQRPVNDNVGSFGDLITTFDKPFIIHLDIKPLDTVEMQCINAAAAVATVGGQILGWYK